MPIARDEITEKLCSDNSLDVLKLLRDERAAEFKNFFLDHMNTKLKGNFRKRGLATDIASNKNLRNNPFEPRRRIQFPPQKPQRGLPRKKSLQISWERFMQISRNTSKEALRHRIGNYINGNANINRYYAYQICIAFGLGLEHSKVFFEDYLNLEFGSFNDWRDILYYYCIQKGHNLKKTYCIYKRCTSEEVGLSKSGLSQEDVDEEIRKESVTILTSVIHNAYSARQFKNDEAFISFMREQKDNFHTIRGHRRKKLKKFMDDIEKKYATKDWDTLVMISNSFAGAFFEDNYDDEDYISENFKDYNPIYFKKRLSSLRGKSKKMNFSREFFILCWLISGGYNIDEIDEILLDEYIKYSEIDVTNLFDAMIYESCKYYERTKEFDHSYVNYTAYERFSDLAQKLSYKRPENFAEEKP